MDLLKGLRLPGELLVEPLNRRSLRQRRKARSCRIISLTVIRFLIIFGRLIGQEIHTFTQGKALFQTGVKLGGGQGNRDAALDMKGHHAVEEQVVLAFGDDFGLTVLGNEYGKLLEVSADEIPGAIFCSGSQFEAVFQAAVRFVRRNDQVLLDSSCS